MMSGNLFSVKKKAEIRYTQGVPTPLVDVCQKKSIRKSQKSKLVRKAVGLLLNKDHRTPIAKGDRGWVAFGFVMIEEVRDIRDAPFMRTRVKAPIKFV